MIETFESQFMQRAFIGGVLVALICAIIGIYISLRKEAIISGAIAHASLAGVAIAYLLALEPLFIALIVGVITSVGITYFQKKTKISSDSIIAMFEAVVFAVGIIMLQLVEGYHPELQTFLFGSILSVSYTNIWILLGIFVFIVVFIFLAYKQLLYVSFDKVGAKIRGVNVDLFDYIIRILSSVVVVASIKIVGIILVTALLVIPSSAAKLFSRNFKQMIPLSILFSFFSVIIGLISSYYLNLPSGATIVVVSTILFFFSFLIKKVS